MKKIISIILSLFILMSLSVPSFALSLTDVDMKELKSIINISDDERILDSAILYPQIVVLTEKNNESLVYLSDDYGENWKITNLTEQFDGFKASGMLWDKFNWPGIHVFGTKNGKLAIINSETMVYWKEVIGQLENENGNIINMTQYELEYILYVAEQSKNYIITSHTLVGDYEKIEYNEKIPEKIIYNKGYFFYCQDNKVYASLDGVNYENKSLSEIVKNEVKEINDYRVQETGCNLSALFITYTNKDNHEKQVFIYMPGNKKIAFEAVETDLDYYQNFSEFGYDVKFTGIWGWPMLISNDENVYLAYLTKDAVRIKCEATELSWVTQYNEPDSWAFHQIMEMGEKGVLTPRTLPKSFNGEISRELFSEYIYNLIKNYESIDMTNKKSAFIDTNNEYINTLANLGIINGTGNQKFSPNNFLTREEAATILNRTINIISDSRLNLINENIKNFEDASKISSWAKDSVNMLSSLGVIAGDNNNNFNPQEKLTAQEALVLISRISTLAASSYKCSLC